MKNVGKAKLCGTYQPQEAYHLQTFGDFLDRRSLRGVATCPTVYRQFSSKRCAGRGRVLAC